MKEKVLALLREGSVGSASQIGRILGLPTDEVEALLEALRTERLFLGWHPLLHPNAFGEGIVRALIEVRITPEREGGFDRLAERIARFEEVESCHLMSGAYDLMVVVRGPNLQSVANFVSARLASIGGVLSTATHFILQAYKEQGRIFERDQRDPDKPAVSP
jgi:DNA-binding Lrp family transcriptional regulator